ncbi:glycosyltransferase family 4 protein [Bacteroides caecimuris]|uniref:glycosyltransferase family 4 protein n=1 Tax=Bacteroides caecimuris TaxID=1796613 RepID=UPI00272D940F|nr:glycosyltransferase family 4 protein [Bacteroides caecimuris]
MKLLHIISSLEIGGAQRLLADLLPIQIKHGLDVDLLVNAQVDNEFNEKIKRAGINIISLDSHNIYSLSNIIRLRKIISSYDIVHVHLFPSLYWAAIASAGLKVKMVYTEHSTSNRRREKTYFRPIEKLIYKRYDRIISISRQTESALQQWLQSSDKRFVVIENGVDIGRFSAICRPVIPKSLIMVSRFAASKDQETLIRSMKYLDKDIVLHLVGDGDNLEHCRSIAKNEGVSDRVMFLGARSDVAELITEAYIGIQSSNWEGFGLTAVEIMAAGKPVVVSDVDGLKQVVEGAGEIFHKGDARELALKISRLLEDKSYYEATAANCKRRSACYDIELMAGKYENLYYELT